MGRARRRGGLPGWLQVDGAGGRKHGCAISGGKPLPVDDQVWIWKEIGTLLAFIGFIALLLGTSDGLLLLPWFAPLAAPPVMAGPRRDGRWWISLIIGAALPAVTLLPFFQLAEMLAPASRLFPQSLTNQIAV